MKHLSVSLFASGALLACASLSSAANIQVDFSANGAVGFAPLFVAFHNGTFDTFDAGSAASSQLETLAEVGDPGELISTVDAAFTAGAVIGSPIVPPGTATSSLFTVTTANSFFNYAAMVLPSNDWFVGNASAINIADLVNGPVGTQRTFNVATVWDAGTEFEDFSFSAGNPIAGITVPAGDAANGTVQGGVVSVVDATDPFSAFANAPAGFDSTAFDFNAGGPIATVTLTVVPEPSTAAFLGLAGLGILMRRRRP